MLWQALLGKIQIECGFTLASFRSQIRVDLIINQKALKVFKSEDFNRLRKTIEYF